MLRIMDLAGVLLDRGLLWIRENWLFLLVVIAAFAVQWRTPRGLRGRLGLMPSRRFAGCLLVILASLVVCLGKSARDGMPLPQFHDDYAYLLAADTFAHGHVANPTHRFADHFETMHVLQHPRYAAQVPPGQGLLLAGGMMAVWLAAAAACAAILWGLRVGAGPPPALLGGLAAAIHPTMLGWAQAYHGRGTAAA